MLKLFIPFHAILVQMLNVSVSMTFNRTQQRQLVIKLFLMEKSSFLIQNQRQTTLASDRFGAK